MTQYNITGLTQGQEYKYRVAANNNIATGSYSTYSQPFTLDSKYDNVYMYMYYYKLVPQPVSSIMAIVTNTTDIGVYNIVVEWEVSINILQSNSLNPQNPNFRKWPPYSD